MIPRRPQFVLAFAAAAAVVSLPQFVFTQQSSSLPSAGLNNVSAQIVIQRKNFPKPVKGSGAANSGEVVLWLKPLDPGAAALAQDQPARKRLQLVQKNKNFQPHLLVVRAGSTVDFPNRDPFFHNVFSLFDGKRFDLGLYEAGATNSARFDRVGVSFLFCNIHPEMSAVVVSVDTPYFAVSNSAGRVEIPGVPDGRYELHLWYERSLPESLRSLTRTVNISSANKDLGTIDIPENPNFSAAHTNKYGQDYTPPPAGTYGHP
jgi:plastocyanin